MTSVELMEQGNDSVIIRTNEGLLTRTNISKHTQADRVVVDFDERYEAGSKLTTTARFRDEFSASDTRVTHRLVIRDVEAPGFLGSFYQRFGSSKTCNVFLTASKAYLEAPKG